MKKKTSPKKRGMTFHDLVLSIKGVHEQCLVQATKAVNISLTLRNWMIGYQIFEYEQGGLDRANYGSRVIEKLASTLHKEIDQCYTGRYLRLCRQLYEVYPQIGKSVISKSDTPQNWKSLISESSVKKLSLQAEYNFVPTEKLIQQLSFTHFIELFKCEDPLKRRPGCSGNADGLLKTSQISKLRNLNVFLGKRSFLAALFWFSCRTYARKEYIYAQEAEQC